MAAYTVASQGNILTNNDAPVTWTHMCGAKPHATTGAALVQFHIQSDTVGGNGIVRIRLARVNPTGPTAQTLEKLTSRSSAAGAAGIIDSTDTAWTVSGGPIISHGQPVPASTSIYTRGWSPPRARRPIVFTPGDANYVTLQAGGGSAFPTYTGFMAFVEPESLAYPGPRSRRSRTRDGESLYRDNGNGFRGLSTAPKGQNADVAEIAEPQPLDWPDSVMNGLAAQLNLLLAGGPPPDDFPVVPAAERLNLLLRL